jgi:hypothetical protein
MTHKDSLNLEQYKQARATLRLLFARSEPPPSPAGEYLRQRLKDGDNVSLAILGLLCSDVPLDQDMRVFIGLVLVIESQPKRGRAKHMLNDLFAYFYTIEKYWLIADDKSALQADEAIAECCGMSVEAMLKRVQRAKPFNPFFAPK